jgi:hypothetical protein
VESGENVTVVGDQGLVALAPGSGYFMLFLGAGAEGRMLWAQSFRWVTVANSQDCCSHHGFEDLSRLDRRTDFTYYLNQHLRGHILLGKASKFDTQPIRNLTLRGHSFGKLYVFGFRLKPAFISDLYNRSGPRRSARRSGPAAGFELGCRKAEVSTSNYHETEAVGRRRF